MPRSRPQALHAAALAGANCITCPSRRIITHLDCCPPGNRRPWAEAVTGPSSHFYIINRKQKQTLTTSNSKLLRYLRWLAAVSAFMSAILIAVTILYRILSKTCPGNPHATYCSNWSDGRWLILSPGGWLASSILFAITYFILGRLVSRSAAREAELARRVRTLEETRHEENRKQEKAVARKARIQADLQDQVASGNFSEDTTAPKFAEDWQRIYERIFYWEDDYEAARRSSPSLGEEFRQKSMKEAEDGLDRTIREWRTAHPDGPIPRVLY